MKYFPDIDDDVPTKFKERKNFSYKKKSFPINSSRFMNRLIRHTSCVSDWIGICTLFRDIAVFLYNVDSKEINQCYIQHVAFNNHLEYYKFDYYLKQAMIMEKRMMK